MFLGFSISEVSIKYNLAGYIIFKNICLTSENFLLKCHRRAEDIEFSEISEQYAKFQMSARITLVQQLRTTKKSIYICLVRVPFIVRGRPFSWDYSP